MSTIQEQVTAVRADIETREAAVRATVEQAVVATRDLTDAEYWQVTDERTRLETRRAELTELEARAAAEQDGAEQAERDRQDALRNQRINTALAQAGGRKPDGHSPLLVSQTHLRSHAEAIREGRMFGAEEAELFTRAVVTVATDMGSEGAWASPSIPGPVTLRAFSGIPNRPLTGASAQHPSLTLPAGAAGVAETADHGEYDTIDVSNLTALRYGRWTSVTALADAFDELSAINAAHAVGVARDLNLVDGGVITTAAGAPVAFSAAALDTNIRAAILKVAAATLTDPDRVVLFGQSASLAPIIGYAPASGGDRGSVTIRVHGARIYTHEAATAKIVYAFNPAAFVLFSSRLRSASAINPANGTNTFGQWMHSTQPGVGVVGGAAAVATLV